jgi:hypothetical protein
MVPSRAMDSKNYLPIRERFSIFGSFILLFLTAGNYWIRTCHSLNVMIIEDCRFDIETIFKDDHTSRHSLTHVDNPSSQNTELLASASGFP